MNMFRGRVVLSWNEPKIVGFQDEHKGISCCRILVRPSCGGSLCHKHFFSNSQTSCSWLSQQLCRRTRLIVCTGLYPSHTEFVFQNVFKAKIFSNKCFNGVHIHNARWLSGLTSVLFEFHWDPSFTELLVPTEHRCSRQTRNAVCLLHQGIHFGSCFHKQKIKFNYRLLISPCFASICTSSLFFF